MARLTPEQKLAKLTKLWYKKASRPYKDKDGNTMMYTDIERGQDFNKLPATTMPRAHGPFLFEPDSDELDMDGASMPLEDTDNAAYWREIGRKANSLPKNWKGRAMILTFADSGSLHTARIAHGLTRWKARSLLASFLEWAELPSTRTRVKAEAKSEPAPVKVLTRDEIVKIAHKLTPPCKIKSGQETD